MTDKFKHILITIAAILFLAGCDSNGSYNAEDVEGAGYILAGYHMMAGEETAISEGTSRATAPSSDTNYSLTEIGTLAADGTEMKFINYPEQGQKTYVTVTDTGTDKDTDNVYLISSKTTYPNHDDVIDYYLEEYYVVDSSDAPFETANANVCDSDGTIDSMNRKTMEVHFVDGSVRYEWIADDSLNMGVYYNHFDLDGDMTIPTDESWEPDTTASGMQWSSKVYYYHNVQADIDWFTVENKEIFGVRYYTEDSDSNSSSLAYEQMISQTTLQSWLNRSDWISDIVTWLFGGGDSSDDVTLAETVIRYELNGNNNKKTTRTTSNVVNSFGNTITIDLETEY